MNTSIGNHIVGLAANLENKVVLADQKGKRYTYGNLADMLAYAAAFYQERGVGKHTRIAVVATSGVELGILFFLVSENCVFVPLDPAFSKSEFEKRYILLDVDILMVEKGYEGPALEGWHGTIMWYSMGNSGVLFEMEPLEKRQGRIAPDQTVMVLTTSGTTSTPKVVPLTMENLLVAAGEKIDFFVFTEDDFNLILTPLFKGTSVNSMLATILSGGSVLVSDGFSLVDFMNTMKGLPVTWFTASPAVLNSIAEHVKKQETHLTGNSLRFIRSSGAPLSQMTKDYLEEAFGVPVIQTYGMTEVRTITSTYGLARFKEGSVGVTLGTQIKIEDGEILVQGRNVFAGYENNEEANAESFSNGWFRTGDLGHVDEDGYVFITGRAKEMINRGGEKISPYEVEAAILSLANVKDVAIFPYPNGYGSDDAGAAVVLEEGQKLTLKELRRQLYGTISPFKMPSLLYVVKEIPLSHSEKVQRKMLYKQLDALYPQVLLSKGEAGNKTQAKRAMTETESRLARIWKELLGGKAPDLQDNFFDLGGDSLAAAELFLAIEEQFHVHVSIDDLFNANTVEELAEIINASSHSNFQFLVKIKDGGKGLPLFFVHSGDGEVVTYHSVSKLMKEDRILWGLKFTRNADWNHPVDFDQLAEKYIHEMKMVQPRGPYRLVGNCHGGVLAYHLACRLRDRGDEVSLLAMFDPLMGNKVVGHGNFGMRKRIWYAWVDIRGRSVRDLPAIVAKKVASFFRVLKFKVEYRLYERACKSKAEKIPETVSSLIILKKAKEITELEKYKGKIHYLLPSKTAKGSAPSIAYWKSMAEDMEVVEFEGTHNYMTSRNATSLTRKMEEILENSHD